jgi:hypothetical protein
MDVELQNRSICRIKVATMDDVEVPESIMTRENSLYPSALVSQPPRYKYFKRQNDVAWLLHHLNPGRIVDKGILQACVTAYENCEILGNNISRREQRRRIDSSGRGGRKRGRPGKRPVKGGARSPSASSEASDDSDTSNYSSLSSVSNRSAYSHSSSFSHASQGLFDFQEPLDSTATLLEMTALDASSLPPLPPVFENSVGPGLPPIFTQFQYREPEEICTPTTEASDDGLDLEAVGMLVEQYVNNIIDGDLKIMVPPAIANDLIGFGRITTEQHHDYYQLWAQHILSKGLANRLASFDIMMELLNHNLITQQQFECVYKEDQHKEVECEDTCDLLAQFLKDFD